MDEQREYTSNEAAESLGISRQTVVSYVDAGLIHARRIGIRRIIRIPENELRRFAQERQISFTPK